MVLDFYISIPYFIVLVEEVILLNGNFMRSMESAM